MAQETAAGTALTDQPGPPSTPEPPATARPGRGAEIWKATRPYRPVLILLIALIIALSISQSGFATKSNVENLLTSVSELWVLALGMTFVLIGGGVDLSVTAIAALVGIVMAKILALGVPGGVAVGVTIAAGALFGGAVNGFLIGKLRLSFFVVTLATMIALTGLVNVWTATQSLYVTAPVINMIALNHIAGIPTPIWLMAFVLAVALFVQKRTYFGRDVYAVGGSIEAARLSGIRASRTVVMIYAVSGACAGLGGVMAIGQIGAASPSVDPTLPLQAIAAVLLGGTSITGGAGSVTGTALGVLFIGTLQNGLGIAGIASFWQQVVTGVILAVAVLADRTDLKRGLAWLRPARRTGDQPQATVVSEGL